ncbi:hypothetical protein K7X08_004299 [Anisodus acutangulus]|uniref:F-box/LRR-repeat protein 15-like leucin rich repeat domain-containing protein n=1 Tax=Anisodus acutangulus TaxID=402998 RepID=A0A9Q1MK58_9SOLA|nr:hypothetical protein K7X08_004299 [Anisodus acutangulus]
MEECLLSLRRLVTKKWCFLPLGSFYPNPKKSSLFSSLGQSVDVYFLSRKRIRVAAPSVAACESFEQKQQPSIEVLPDECLFEKATDARHAAIAVGTASHGGLGKLSIRGNNPCRGVTDAGLKAIARGCPSLRDLSLWNVSSVGDEGLSKIAHGCHLLEKLDLCQCPAVTDKSLLDIAKNCPNLTSLTIDSCSNIGNESLQAVGRYCPNLKVIAVNNCSLIGDQGISGLFSSAGHVLIKVKFQALNISDVSLAVIGHYGIAVTDLALGGLRSVKERSFWVMGNGQDNGLVAFVKASVLLENLPLEECHGITQTGFFGVLFNCGKKLEALSLGNCFGVKDLTYACPLVARCNSVQSLAIRNCPVVGNATIAVLGRLCPELTHLELSGLLGITDEGLFPLVQSCVASLVEVNLSGCVNVADKSISAIAKLHGGTLESLIIDGCRHVTDETLVEISNSCWLLDELDVSKCGITDSGIANLASVVQLTLQILSLSGCPMVSDKSLPFLHELGQNLQGLNIQHCRGINSSTVDVLVEQLCFNNEAVVKILGSPFNGKSYSSSQYFSENTNAGFLDGETHVYGPSSFCQIVFSF